MRALFDFERKEDRAGNTARQRWLMGQDPEIDRLLVKWGYRPRATHPEIILEQLRRLKQKGEVMAEQGLEGVR